MENKQPKLLIFASGTKTAGGSGFRNLVESMRAGILKADIVAVVSNHQNGGVANHAHELNIPFVPFGGGDATAYQKLTSELKPDFITLSGWLKHVKGLDAKTTFNIHPGPLPDFGGPGLFGHHVHEAVLESYKRGKITHSAVSMHFVTEEYDRGPIFFQHEVAIKPDDTPETLGTRVNQAEHYWQPIITNLVVQNKIRWDGVNPNSLITEDF
jgi:phosphoribosylglycinamide formyltransferase-1